jgi:hypothetical protein
MMPSGESLVTHLSAFIARSRASLYKAHFEEMIHECG